MTALEYLEQANGIDDAINSLLAEKKYWNDLRFRISGSQFTNDRVSGGRADNAPFTHAEEEIERIEREIDEQVDKLVDLKREIGNTISSLNKKEGAVLRYRYIANFSISAIARHMNKDERTIQRMHESALKNLKFPSLKKTEARDV